MKHANKRLSKRTLCLLLALSMLLVLIPFSALADDTQDYLTNGDFETTDGASWEGEPVGWTVSVANSENTAWGEYGVTTDAWAAVNTTSYLHLTNYTGSGDMIATATQTVALAAGTYTATIQSAGESQGSNASGLALTAVSGGTTLASSAITLGGWDTWATATITFTLEDAADVTVGVTGTLADSSYCDLDNATLTASAGEGGGSAEEPSEGYAVAVTPSTTDVKAGDTVTLTAKVTYNGEEVTDLAAGGLYLWWWTDVWAEGHTDGLSDAAYSNNDGGSGLSLTADVTLPSEGTYYIAAELQDSTYSNLTTTFTTFNVAAASAGPVELANIPLENGDFENGTANWTLSGFSSVATDSWAVNNTTNTLNLWLSDSEAVDGSAAYTVTLTAGTYQFGFGLSGAQMDSGLGYSVTVGDTVLVSGSETYTTAGWDVWATYTTGEFTLTENTEVTFTLSGSVPAGYWGNLDNLTLKGTGSIAEEDTAVEADINVQKVSGLSDDFIMGMDISSVISEFNSGVTYQDFDGNIIDNVTDFCRFLAQCGVTTVRVRVWNDPYDADGNGYGGGNNDVATAVEIAKGCAAAGLDMLIDFHCSDFWTDPGKQQAPKAWAGYTVDEKAAALQVFLTESLAQIQSTGAEIAMVQVGNETTGGFIGETSVVNMCTLFNAGASAVRAFDPSIKVVIHITNPEKSTMTTWAKNLDTYSVDYDVLATSYYSVWHGTLENLKSQLKAVQDTYGKDVMVAETSYAFTMDETDGHTNTVRENASGLALSYSVTPQGQADCIRDIIAAVSEAGGLGVFYWEPAWITVGDTTGLTGEAYDAQVKANKALWEQYGSGWASSYAAQYDPDDAGVWYGGSAVDNQAMFYADGSPVASINVWNLVKTGAYSNHISVDAIAAPAETIFAGESCHLPETVTVTYSNGAVEEPVEWNAEDISAIDISSPGTYIVNGTVTFSQEVDTGDYAGKASAQVTYVLTVKAPNLIDKDVASFEVPDDSDFTIDGSGVNLPATDDPKEGSHSMHWWYTSATTTTVTYNEVITLPAGAYTFEAAAQGYAGDTVTLNILDADGNILFSGNPTALTGWAVWMTPSVSFQVTEETQIKVQIEVSMQAGGWGTVDCLYLYKTGEATTPPAEPEEPTAPVEPDEPSTPVEPEEPTAPVEPEEPSTPVEPDEPTDSDIPKTGENTLVLCFAALLVSSLGIAVILMNKQKFKNF